jgi:hypothetical protein
MNADPKRTPSRARRIVDEIERIRLAVINDDSIERGDARWHAALHRCRMLYDQIGYIHPDYYDDPHNNYRS